MNRITEDDKDFCDHVGLDYKKLEAYLTNRPRLVVYEDEDGMKRETIKQIVSKLNHSESQEFMRQLLEQSQTEDLDKPWITFESISGPIKTSAGWDREDVIYLAMTLLQHYDPDTDS